MKLPDFKKKPTQSRHGGGQLSEVLTSLIPEDVMIELGVDYRIQQGSSGEQFNIKECPRCGGREWKVFLNTDTALGNCFHGSCVGEPGFNLYTFAKYWLDDTDKETVNFFLQLHQAIVSFKPKPKAKPQAVAPAVEAKTSSLLVPVYVKLPHKGKNLDYLTERGFSFETTQRFEWGYCVKGSYVAHPNTPEEIKQDYSKRVIIPIRSLDGDFISFQGRDITGKAKRKYLFPPGLPGSGRFLYGGHLVVGESEIIINEGVFDVADVHQKLNMPAVGTFGKSISSGSFTGEDQIGALLKLKKSGLKIVHLMWDGETSTLLDATKAALAISSVGFKVNIVILPGGKDPNEASKEELERAMSTSIPVTKSSMIKLKMKLMRGDVLPQMLSL